MIRHRPWGRGHPYLVEPDQVVPVRPLASEAYELRATTPPGTDRLWLETSQSGTTASVEAVRRGPAVPEVDAVYGTTAQHAAEKGHLSDAMARLGAQSRRESWTAPGPLLGAGERLRYRFSDGKRRTRWFELAAACWEPTGGDLAVDSDASGLGERIMSGSLEWLMAGGRAYRCRFALSLMPGDHVVGFGERYNGLDQRGKRVDVAVFDQYKGQGARSYMPMPFAFVVGESSFALYLETGRRTRFDVGAGQSDEMRVEVDFEPGETVPRLRLLLLKGRPEEALPKFLRHVGNAQQPPPDWAFRLWMSGNEWDNQARVLAEVERSELEGIPVGAVVVEAWSDETTFVAFNDSVYEPHPDGGPHRLTDFTFPPQGRWPDPKAMVDTLHRRGAHVILWQVPLVLSGQGQAGIDRKVMQDRHYCVSLTDGRPYRNRGWWFPGALLCDFTNPEARSWWTAKRRYLVDEVGVDGFKTDGGEHAWGSDLVFADGRAGGEATNLYPVHYGAAYHELMRASGRPPLTFSRAGFVGSAAVPCHWAGDEDSTWEGFRASISAGLTASACGITFWGWDLAGFSGEVPTVELYLRAAAMAALCPIMQYHSEYNHHRTPSRDRTPWNVAERNNDRRAITVFRRFVQLRERLVPYLVEQSALALERGQPLMRALMFETSDARAWEFDDEYLLGEDLLVAPVTQQGSLSRTVFLPDGAWVDAWSDEWFSGPLTVERGAPLDEIPVYVRGRRAGELGPLFRNLS